MTETVTRPQDANAAAAADPGDLEPPVVTAVRFLNLIEIIAHLADRISHLESRVDEEDFPFHPELIPEPGWSFSEGRYSIDYGVTP